MSGAELAGALRMPRSTFATAIAQLERQGRVVQVGKANGGRGRPSHIYRLKLPAPVVSLQVEGTQLSGGLFDQTLELLALETVAPRDVQSLDQAIEACKALLGRLLESAGGEGVKPGGVAVSLNAVQSGQRILASSVLPWVTDDLERQLADCLHLPVRLCAPSSLAAEYQKLRGIPQSFVLFHVADGVSAHMIANRDFYCGQAGLAGELGHVSTDAAGPLCGCGKRGCLEAYCGGPAIQRRVAGDLCTGIVSQLEVGVFMQSTAPEAMQQLWEAWGQGDAFARTCMADVLGRLGWGLGLAQNLLDPQVISFGGYVLAGRQAWIDEICRASEKWILRPAARGTQFLQAVADLEDELRVAAARFYYPINGHDGLGCDAAS
jgi:predicted NBD/HSP70 family sugar kinase